MFVDISGFTAMSERLARLGRVGAEEVTDLLNHTFSRLLAVAYEDDGSLLKFGGDALLVQFDGPGHVERAVHAAWGMRRKLRELQPLRTSVGLVRLRMSVGVHTGPIDQFLVGLDHRELVVAGPVATETVRMENAANAGEILVSRAVRDAMADRASFLERGAGFLLRGTPPAPRLRGGTAQPIDGRSVAGRLLSDAVRSRLSAGGADGEHRASVIGFIKVLGIDDLLSERGATATADALEEIVDTVNGAIAPDEICFLSTDVDANGTKIILTAGVPTSKEFDGERMLRALRRIVETDLPLPLKIGVNHGPVYAGVVGPWFRLTYTIIGDAVNTAARVMGHAQPGQVLATPEVLNRSNALFDVHDVPPFAVKGKKRPIDALDVGELAAGRLRRPRARFRLAGRREEIAALLDELTLVEGGTGRAVQLVGPAGIGKSRLVDEIHERVPYADIRMVACNQFESATPYYVVGALVRNVLDLGSRVPADALADAVSAVAPELMALLPLLGDVVGIDVPDTSSTRELTASYRTQRTADAVVALLEAAVPEPAVVVFEDLHWVDPESWNVIRNALRVAAARRRWLTILTSRHRLLLDLDGAFDERVIELAPLPLEESRELVYAAVEEGLVTIDRGNALLERAGGNPFFLQELLQASADGDELPESVDALLQAQLDQLPVRDREVLSYAAVLGVDVDVELLERTTGISAGEQRGRFDRLSTFVEPAPGGGYRFRHALVHDGAYSRLPFKRRREVHLAAAAALEADGPEARRVDLLALHTYHAKDWPRARAYSIEAARAAGARYANLTAAAHYRRAVEAARYVRDLTDAELADTWERLADALMLASSYDDAVAAYTKARRLSDPDRQVHLCGQIGQLRERQARFDDALRWLNRAIRLNADRDGSRTARMLVESAIVKIRQGKPDEAILLGERAETLAEDPLCRARSHYVRAWAGLLMGEDRVEDRRRMLELFEESGDLIGQGLAYNVISMTAYYRGDWDEAATAYQHAASLRKRVGDEVAAAAATGNLGELLSDQGHFERARGLLEECRTVCAATGFRSSQYFAEMTLGRLAARLGDYEGASVLLKDSLCELERLKMASLALDAQRYLGELRLFRGDYESALASADELEGGTAAGNPAARLTALRLRACALLAVGELTAAADVAGQLLETVDPDARDYETALALVAAAAVLGETNDPRGSEIGSRADGLLARLGVVVPGDLLVFGPTSTRGRMLVVTDDVIVFAKPSAAAHATRSGVYE